MKRFSAGLLLGFTAALILGATHPKNPAPQCPYPIRISRWIDGDTAVADIYLGFDLILQNQRIRLARVNTPEKGQAGFQTASNLSANTCPVNSTASLTPSPESEKYGRILGEITCSGKNLNDMLRGKGWKNSAR